MIRKAGSKFITISLCLIIGTIFFSVQSCNRDRSTGDQSDPVRISAVDYNPSWSPDGRHIVFVSYREGNSKIYIMNADGSYKTRLIDNPASDFMPSWSPDGTRIAFVSDRDGNKEIYIMNADGSNQTRLTENMAEDRFPSWSPDCKQIVFDSDRDDNREIYIMNADGSDQTRLTENTTNDGAPSWSPDGSRIVFESRRDGNPEIYIMDADGSDQTRLTENSTGDGVPRLSPDGTRIAFISDREGNFEIYTMNTDGSDPIRLTFEPGTDQFPCWSPDGRRIAFSTDRDFDSEVYVMNADSSNPVNLTTNAPINAAIGMAPLPRSEVLLGEIPWKIVFESFRETEGKENWEICQIDAQGSNLINLTNTPEVNEMYPHASPDGRFVCFVADEGESLENRRRNVYFMNIDGSERVKVAENAYQPCWSGGGRYIAYLPGEYPKYNASMRANKGLEIYDLQTKEVKSHPNEKIIKFARICWSPVGRWLVASGLRSNVAFRADDKTMMRLSMPGCTPDICSDGKRIAWNGTDWNLNIGRLDFDSSQNNVTDHRIVIACARDHWVYHADWSPDGNYLAFTYAPYKAVPIQSRPAPGSNICICDLKTGKWTQVTTDGKHNKEPDWVPKWNK